jgi:hypothetical protein
MKINKNKKAWLKIIEAVFAIMIISAVALTILSNRNESNETANIVHEKQSQILNIIIKNDSMRNIITTKINTENDPNINSNISLMTPKNWEFKTKICYINGNCTISGMPSGKEVYVKEAVIYSTPNSTKLRFWVWMK